MKRNLIYYSHADLSDSQSLFCKITINHQQYSCQLVRVSGDGITLSCDQFTLDKMHPKKHGSESKSTIQASFYLNRKIHSECKIHLTRRLSKDKFVVELKFVDIDEVGLEEISRVVHQKLAQDDMVETASLASIKNETTSFSVSNDYRLSKVA